MSLDPNVVLKRYTQLSKLNGIEFFTLDKYPEITPPDLFDRHVSVDKLKYGKWHHLVGAEITLESTFCYYTWVEVTYTGKNPRRAWSDDIDFRQKTVVFGETWEVFILALNTHLDQVEQGVLLPGMDGEFAGNVFKLKGR